MLIAFLKDEREAAAQCRIVKYVDRIYAKPSLFGYGGHLEVRRDVCIEVLADSPVPVHSIRMLCPTAPSYVQDASVRLLEQSKFTEQSTDYQILDRGMRRIRWDGLGEVRIAKGIKTTIENLGASNAVVGLDFCEEVKAGERFGFGLRMRFTQRLVWVSTFRRRMRLNYFLGKQAVPGALSGFPAHEIRCLTRYAGEAGDARVAGGFDVKVCYPAKLTATASPSGTPGEIAFDADCNPISKSLSMHTWRLRLMANEQEVGWKTHWFPIGLDVDFPHMWPMFILAVLSSVVIAVVFGPWLRSLFWGVGP